MTFRVLEKTSIVSKKSGFQGEVRRRESVSEPLYIMSLDVSENIKSFDDSLRLTVSDLQPGDNVIEFTSTSIESLLRLVVRMRVTYLKWKSVPRDTRLRFGSDWKSQMKRLSLDIEKRDTTPKDPSVRMFREVFTKYIGGSGVWKKCNIRYKEDSRRYV